jgi:hypothetical protein
MGLRRQILAAVRASASTLLAVACTAVSTSMVAPSSQKCQISVTSEQTSFAATGGAAALDITAARDCTWNVAAEVAWVQLTGERSGQGDARVPFTIAANLVPSPRSSAITVGTQQLQISQAAAACTFQLAFTHKNVPPAGEQASVGVTTLTGCSWRADSESSWITAVSGQSGNASGTVVFSVARNTGAARNGQLMIAGQRFTVAQEAAAPPPPTNPPPTNPPPPPSPPAPPPSEETVDFAGRVSGLSGRCPDVSFSAGGQHVSADKTTDYREGRCSDLSNGDTVRVRGASDDKGVHATRITFEENHD